MNVQHDLDKDEPLPRTGDLFKLRKPFWERGAHNISFLISQLKQSEPHLDLSRLILIGHSNGGDISMMFADKYSTNVSKIISLDSLRYPFPIDKNIQILHFGANDTKADEGVIPTTGVKTFIIKDVKHIDLCDRGSARIKGEVLELLSKFLQKDPS